MIDDKYILNKHVLKRPYLLFPPICFSKCTPMPTDPSFAWSTSAPIDAHQRSTSHREEIDASLRCGCFYCISIFPADSVDWDRFSPTTGACPNCGIDSVIGDVSGYPIIPAFLRAMQDMWFC